MQTPQLAQTGFFDLIAQAGPVAKAVLLLLLSGSLSRPGAAAAVVLLSRFVVTASDVVAAALAWLYDRSHHFVTR